MSRVLYVAAAALFDAQGRILSGLLFTTDPERAEQVVSELRVDI